MDEEMVVDTLIASLFVIIMIMTFPISVPILLFKLYKEHWG